MSAPYDQLHDVSLEKPNAPPRGMHGQSAKRSQPYDERHAQELKSKLQAAAKNNETKTPAETEESNQKSNHGPAPRGMHGESVMRSQPYDERFAKEGSE